MIFENVRLDSKNWEREKERKKLTQAEFFPFDSIRALGRKQNGLFIFYLSTERKMIGSIY